MSYHLELTSDPLNRIKSILESIPHIVNTIKLLMLRTLCFKSYIPMHLEYKAIMIISLNH